MKAAIVDTDVVSMLFKGDTRVLSYRTHIEGRLLGISFMTLAELERWPLERGWVVRQVGRNLLRREEERAADPDRRRLDCGERPPLSGSAHHQQSERLFGCGRTDLTLSVDRNCEDPYFPPSPPWNFMLAWAPLQKGLLSDAPQRQRVTRLRFS